MDQLSKSSSTPYKPLENEDGFGSGKLVAHMPQSSGVQPPAYGPLQQTPGAAPPAYGYPQQAPSAPPPAYGYPQQAPGAAPPVYGYPQQAPMYQPQPQGAQVPKNDGPTVLHDLPVPPTGFENTEVFGPSFEDKSVRSGFVRKVYTILLVQLLVTTGIIALFIFHQGIKYTVTHSMGLYLSAYIVFIVTYITLSCCKTIRRQHPYNYIFLVVFTLSMAYMSGVISAFYDVSVVFMSMGITAAVCLGVSVFAIQTKWDVTGYGLYLWVASLVILLFGIISIFVAIYVGSMIMNLVYSGLIALLFSLYLVFDTQQIIGGRKIQLSPEEYIYGALQLYVDVMEIFLAILRLSGRK